MNRPCIFFLVLLVSCNNAQTVKPTTQDSITVKNENVLTPPIGIDTLDGGTWIYHLHSPEVQKNGDELRISGDLFLETGALNVTIKTPLLDLKVQAHSQFWLSAPKKDPWGEIKLVKGEIIAEKNYRSDYPAPDTVHAGELLMINKTVDIMEKEKDSLNDVCAWMQLHLIRR